MTETETIYDKAYKQLVGMISSRKLTLGDMITLTTYAMKIAEQFKLPGDQKKRLVIELVQAIVKNADFINEKDRPNIELFVELTLPLFIDAAVHIVNDPTFQKKKKNMFNCCRK